VYLTSKKLEDCPFPIVELQMPINSYWDIEKHLKKIDFMLATGDSKVEVFDSLMIFFRKVEPFAVTERDRVYLRGRFSGQNPSLQNKG
jgi:hypothetical protein